MQHNFPRPAGERGRVGGMPNAPTSLRCASEAAVDDDDLPRHSRSGCLTISDSMLSRPTIFPPLQQLLTAVALGAAFHHAVNSYRPTFALPIRPPSIQPGAEDPRSRGSLAPKRRRSCFVSATIAALLPRRQGLRSGPQPLLAV